MLSHEGLVVKEQRLSLDLPQGHHDMIKQIAKYCGFPSKTEVVKAAVRHFYDQMSLVLEGNEIVALTPGTDNEFLRFHGTDLADLARRVRKQRGEVAPAPPKAKEAV